MHGRRDVSEINHELLMHDARYGIRFTKGEWAGRTGRLLGAATCHGFDAQVDGTGEIVYVEPPLDYEERRCEERREADRPEAE